MSLLEKLVPAPLLSGALFALSMGMGTPLLLVGASAGQLLPKVGPWMNTVKAGFGVMLIAVIVFLGALTFLPAAALGPVAEHLQFMK